MNYKFIIYLKLKENKALLKVEDENNDNWKEYTAYIDRIVLEGFYNTVACNFQYWLTETDHNKSNIDPLFETQLHLKETDVFFLPSMNGVYDLIEEMISSVFTQGSLIPRVASHFIEQNYQVKFKTLHVYVINCRLYVFFLNKFIFKGRFRS